MRESSMGNAFGSLFPKDTAGPARIRWSVARMKVFVALRGLPVGVMLERTSEGQ